ncbi:acyl-CoA thioester hydrolase YbgC [Salmonella enterica subsp. enterica]|uniref:Acyl-CoA thioester hydrolase YbgC n=1 Tax=Salmonella enterica I TaxID=59201 RepID=A0A447MVK3_SALET|nr:acyl-CoA thioester hydrolase YbgC [Salmonella enterica subsp. enterica]
MRQWLNARTNASTLLLCRADYQGTGVCSRRAGSLTLYGTGEKPIDVKIGMAIDGEMSVADWRAR